MNCIACDSADLAPLYSTVSPDGLLAKEYEILRCSACGMGYTRPVPTREELAILYSGDYHAPERATRFGRCAEFLRRLFLAHRFKLIAQEVKGGALLDYGCGNGEFVEYARGEAVDAVGIEPNYPASSRFVKNSTNELPPDARYDLITLWHVLEHIERPEEELRALAGRLADNGRIFISVPNFRSWEARFGKRMWFHLDAPRHICHYTPRSLELVMRKSGLRLKTLSFSFGFYGVFGMFQTLLNLCGKTNFLYYSLKRGTDFRGKMSCGRYVFNLLCHVCLVPALLPLAAALSLAAALFGRAGSMEAICEKA